MDETPHIVKGLYDIVDRLEKNFEGRKFSLDGHIVGSLGEVLSAYRYDLSLLRNSTESHDAVAKDGRLVQIKATQRRKSVGLRCEPEHSIVYSLIGRVP